MVPGQGVSHGRNDTPIFIGTQVANSPCTLYCRLQMVSFHDSCVLLAKSRRLLVTSKRLLRDLEDCTREPVNSQDAGLKVQPKNPPDRFQTKPARVDCENAAPIEAETTDPDASSVIWNRPRRPR